MGHGASSPRRVRYAHRRVNVVPLNYNSGLLLADNEAGVRGVCVQE